MTLDVLPSQQSVHAVLLEGVQRGEEAAFRDLYDLTRARVHQVVLATTRSPEHAAEVVQEVYLYVWLHATTFDADRGSVLGWILMLARRRAVDRVRHVVRTNRREQRDAASTALTVPDVADLGLARHEAARLRGALQHLSELQRDAVVLTFLGGYTHEQAAVLLGVPLGTLKTRVRAGVMRLRHRLEAPAA
ncbi:sigma-70 family RNA polymerase sigma factor [Microlunatus antarcticus]|uniref:RNA polymerase sigma-70 factor (ECF subfamily) n=1 Tax=Microlunatus antarcticus TaxID=53388 RepID=A0A7W5JWA6_9ACTN|nr:RNA polymerase sigma-70 factor (ECF subfamily) [Microlunatus antarcticus]